MVAGTVITYMRPFKIGYRVKIGEITGDVMEKTMLVTRIRTVKNEDVTVPNSTVLLVVRPITQQILRLLKAA
jgi:small-conductance mechanosensitive channel